MCFFDAMAARNPLAFSRSRCARRGTVSSGFLLALSVFLVGPYLVTPAVADTLSDFQKRQLYDLEQCASTCQVELDKRLFSCPEFKDDSENIEVLNCRAETRDLYHRCTQMCPADPRPDQQ